MSLVLHLSNSSDRWAEQSGESLGTLNDNLCDAQTLSCGLPVWTILLKQALALHSSSNTSLLLLLLPSSPLVTLSPRVYIPSIRLRLIVFNFALRRDTDYLGFTCVTFSLPSSCVLLAFSLRRRRAFYTLSLTSFRRLFTRSHLGYPSWFLLSPPSPIPPHHSL